MHGFMYIFWTYQLFCLRGNVSCFVNHVGVFADVLFNHEWDLVIKAIGPYGLLEILARPGLEHHRTLFHRYSLLGGRGYLLFPRRPLSELS